MKKLAFLSVLLFSLGIASESRATIIDIVELADGSFQIYSDRQPYGNVSTRAAAEKVANKLGNGGNSIYWGKESQWNGSRWFSAGENNAATSATTSTKPSNTPPKTNPGSTMNASQKALPAAPEQKLLTSGNNPVTTTPKATSNLPATTTKPGSNLPATTNGTTAAGTGAQKALPAGTSTPKAAAATPKVNLGGAALGALGVVSGAVGMYDSVKSKDTKATWGDVGSGALSGTTFAAGSAAIVNAIPIGGQVAYGVAMAAGAVVGASGAGAKMFSETDCDMDPVTGQYACCNVSDLTNIQARYCNIGDEMFAEFPYVRTCMQGKNKFESNWFKARFLDDHWSNKGEVKFCKGYQMPAKGDYNIQAYGSSEANGKVCWTWECADPGMKRQGNKCVADQCPEKFKDAYVPCWGEQTKMGATKCYRKCHANFQGATTMIVECKDGYKPDEENTGWKTEKGERLYAKCVPGKKTTGSCSSRTTINGKACCDTGKMGLYDQATDTCKCNGDLKFVIENGKGYCRSASTTPTAYTCDPTMMANVAQWKNSCANNAEITETIKQIEDYCSTPDKTQEGFMTFYTTLLGQNPQNCGNNEQQSCGTISGAKWSGGQCVCIDSDQEMNADGTACVETAAARQRREEAAREAAIAASTANITNIGNKINNLRAGLSTSVWKNKEGNFNTSRLVSDSVAGVVLGTAGGLITSHVIKKNQLKGGFEDISCTIRGQTVARYGDEFQVGIQ